MASRTLENNSAWRRAAPSPRHQASRQPGGEKAAYQAAGALAWRIVASLWRISVHQKAKKVAAKWRNGGVSAWRIGEAWQQ